MRHLLFLTLIVLAWALIVISLCWVFVPVTLGAIVFPGWRPYRRNLWLWSDNGVNVLLTGGNPDITVSSKIGYLAYTGSRTAARMAKVVDWVWLKVLGEKDHCYNAIEWDEIHNVWWHQPPASI